MMQTLLLLAALALPLALVPAAGALVIENGAENTDPPPDDPGWDNVGRVEGAVGAVYLGHGWAATAKHVYLGSQLVTFAGVTHPIVPGSEVVIEHDATSDADLKVFRIYPPPRMLPALAIATGVSASDDVTLIGYGRSNAGPVGDPPTGYLWGGSGIKRWGTNRLGGTVGGTFYVSVNLASGNDVTRSLITQFDAGGTPFEAGVAGNDSGGALFVDEAGSWQLAGIQWAVLSAAAGMTTIGDDGASADLTFAPYRDQVLAITRPCDDGVDNDLDGLSDADDPGCLGPGDLSEEPACDDGLDNDADGQVDLGDGDCGAPGDLLEAADGDGDGVADIDDNCSETPNPLQLDATLDGYGDACDADYDGDGLVGIPDFQYLTAVYGTVQGQPGFDPAADHNSDGAIGLPDYTYLGSAWSQPLGPSGLGCAGSPPCF